MDQYPKAKRSAELQRLKQSLETQVERALEAQAAMLKKQAGRPYTHLEIKGGEVIATLKPFFYGREFYNEIIGLRSR